MRPHNAVDLDLEVGTGWYHRNAPLRRRVLLIFHLEKRAAGSVAIDNILRLSLVWVGTLA